MRQTLVRSMRPTLARRSDMPGPKVYSLWWGDQSNVIKQKGIVQYTISPYAAKAAPNMFSDYLFNGYRRIAADFFYVAIPFAIAYGTWTWAQRKYSWLNSKEGHLAAMAKGGH